MPKTPQTPQERLNQLESEIRFGRVTIGFSIEDRDANGQKRWSMVSATAQRENREGWAPEEAEVVACLVSKRIVTQVYLDAVVRRMVSKQTASGELKAACERYDVRIKKLLEKQENPDS